MAVEVCEQQRGQGLRVQRPEGRVVRACWNMTWLEEGARMKRRVWVKKMTRGAKKYPEGRRERIVGCCSQREGDQKRNKEGDDLHHRMIFQAQESGCKRKFRRAESTARSVRIEKTQRATEHIQGTNINRDAGG